MKAGLLTFIVLFSKMTLAGFDFAPIVASLNTNGPGATTSFTITNLDPTKLAVQVSIVAREPDIDGKEDYKESDKVNEMFRIFPSQIVLEPKGVRTVRVTYIGPSQLKSELPFRIIAEELPVDLDDPSKVYTKPVAKITMSTRYIGSLYVTPASAKPDIQIDAKRSETKATDLVVEVTNKGTAHQVYRKPIVKVLSKSTGKELTLSDEDAKPFIGQNVLAGKTRRYSIPWPKGLDSGPLKVMLEVPKE